MEASNDATTGWLKGLGGLLSAAPQLGKFGSSAFNPTSVTSMWGGGGEDAVAAGYFR
jgi:hypothetical protein